MPLNQDPNFWLALGQLANGSTVGQQIGNTSNALMNYNNAQTTRNEALDAQRLQMQKDAQARQEQLAQTNKTLEYLNTVDPELAKAVQAGVIDPKTAMTRAWEAQKPKDWKENYMNVGGNLIAPDASGKIQTVYSPPAKPEASPETIRLLQAAGIDPNSQQGKQIIMNRLAPKGTSLTVGADGTVQMTQGNVDKAPSVEAGKVSQFYGQASKAEQVLSNPAIIGQGQSLPNKILAQLPGDIGNYGLSPEAQQYLQAKRTFINSTLRRESGAVISDSEEERANKQYFPQPGDSPEVVAQKNAARQTAIQGMRYSSGPGAEFMDSQGQQGGVQNAEDYFK